MILGTGSVFLVILWAGFSFPCHEPESSCYLDVPPVNLSTCDALDSSLKDTVKWSQSTPLNLDVEFPLSSLGCYKYVVELMFRNVSEENCTTDFPESNSGKRHTRSEFKVEYNVSKEETIKTQACGKTAVMSFKYVFEGCYFLKVTPYSKTGSQSNFISDPKYIKNNYTHMDLGLVDSKPKFFQQFQRVSNVSTVSVLKEQHIDNPYFMVILNINQASYHKCNSSTNKCFANSDLKDPPSCTVSNKTSINIKCDFYNIRPGNYCVQFFLEDERCCSNTVWNSMSPSDKEMCFWYYDYPIKEESKSNPTVVSPGDPTEGYITYIIIGVVTAIVFLIVAILGIFLRSCIVGEATVISTPETPPELIVSREPCQIFLLYARDCQPFMDLMASLRDVLEDATKSEVIDCLDASRWNEVGRSPAEWVRGHIERRNTKVVLVATNCAYLRQKAHLSQATITYKQPSTYDSLFIHGLKALTDDISPNYRKISVIRFEGFSDDEILLNHLTSYRRFVLPGHLHNLISNLQQSESLDQDILEVETKEVQKLNQDLTNLINFKRENVDYLQDMLVIQR